MHRAPPGRILPAAPEVSESEPTPFTSLTILRFEGQLPPIRTRAPGPKLSEPKACIIILL